jgi:hypothetical protein
MFLPIAASGSHSVLGMTHAADQADTSGFSRQGVAG